MSELNSTIDFLESATGIGIETPPTDSDFKNEKEPKKKKKKQEKIKEEIQESSEIKFFDIQEFGQELYTKSEIRNRERAERPNQNITGYDIAHNCIQQVLFKLRNTPIKNYADSWLPIFMRTEVGSAVHNFIQGNTDQFTEVELNLKVPSIGFYGKIDYMIGNNVLGEIKTCTYEDYKSVIRKQQPREKDFLQAFTYHYIISNYLDEILAKSTEIKHGMGDKPKLNHYDISKIQFLYIAHDLISSQAESYAEMMETVKIVKKNLESKKNPFFFITSIIVDITDELKNQFYELIKNKFDDIHHYLRTNTNPTKDARFVNSKNCFFCPYRQICKLNEKIN